MLGDTGALPMCHVEAVVTQAPQEGSDLLFVQSVGCTP